MTIFHSIIEVDALVQLLARISDHEFTKHSLRFHRMYSKKRNEAAVPAESSGAIAQSRGASSQSRVASSQDSRSSPQTIQSSTHRNRSDKRVDLSFLTYDYTPHDWSNEIITSLSELSLTQQQNALIEDLLYVLVVRTTLLYYFSAENSTQSYQILFTATGNRRTLHS